MTEIDETPETRECDALARAHSSLDDTYEYLAEMAETLVVEVKEEWDKWRQGGGNIRDLNNLLGSELRSLLRLAKETEGSLHGIRIDRAGKAGAFAIDFDAARSEVGRQLDRIRASRDTDDVPEPSE